MNEIIERLAHHRLVPVVKIDRAEDAPALAEALLAGGLPLIEVTFRTEAAEGAIRSIAQAYPEMLVGAGTVLSVENVDKAVSAGAAFIVTPGFNPRVVEHCLAGDLPVIPGVVTPSEIEMGLERKLPVLKFFPAEASGGLDYLKAVSAPYGGVRFVPTGGVDAGNLLAYLSFDRVIACGGSWFVKDKLINAGNFVEIRRLTEQAMQVVGSAPTRDETRNP